jgi:hypothetical protein
MPQDLGDVRTDGRKDECHSICLSLYGCIKTIVKTNTGKQLLQQQKNQSVRFIRPSVGPSRKLNFGFGYNFAIS